MLLRIPTLEMAKLLALVAVARAAPSARSPLFATLGRADSYPNPTGVTDCGSCLNNPRTWDFYNVTTRAGHSVCSEYDAVMATCGQAPFPLHYINAFAYYADKGAEDTCADARAAGAAPFVGSEMGGRTCATCQTGVTLEEAARIWLYWNPAATDAECGAAIQIVSGEATPFQVGGEWRFMVNAKQGVDDPGNIWQDNNTSPTTRVDGSAQLANAVALSAEGGLCLCALDGRRAPS